MPENNFFHTMITSCIKKISPSKGTSEGHLLFVPVQLQVKKSSRSYNSTYRAACCACTALYASLLVNLIMRLTLADSLNRASTCARTAGDTLITNLVSHYWTPPSADELLILQLTLRHPDTSA